MIICDVGPLWGHLSTHRGPKRPFLGPTRSLEGPGGPRRAPGGLIWSQLPQAGPTGWAAFIPCALASYQTSSALLGPRKGPVLAQNSPLEGPGRPWLAWGSDLVPTAASWSNWVELMVTTNFDLVLDLFSAAKCPKRPLFGPKCPF